jgi:hypothetical protein
MNWTGTMADLSPAAQAVLDAFWKQPGDRSALAASLIAAVDQVVPAWPCGNDCCVTTCEQIRADFLAIVAELNDPPQ